MVERNMIREGFVFNTLNDAGTASGTQNVTIPEINSLVDNNTSVTALTVTGAETIVLDADLGARWKLDRIEYYTDESSTSNFTMSISDNNIDFTTITMTGTSPLYVGDISSDPTEGAPRYIRLEHNPPTLDTIVREWKAINDDSLVDFGSDGSLTEVTISDSPIGKKSTTPETLALFNSFSKTATGFVFIDNTGTEADNEIEISTTSFGPFVGRSVSNTSQPNVTAWSEGSFDNTRVVLPSGLYSIDFSDNDAKGWTALGFSSSSVAGGVFLGNSSSLTPSFLVNTDFGNNEASFIFHADDVDTVLVKLNIPTLNPDDFIEGPKLFWANQVPGSTFVDERSALSTTPSGNFTGDLQEFQFDVGSVTTWSGTIRGFQIQPYTATSGTGIPIEFHSLDAIHSSGQDRVSLSFDTISSGTFADFSNDGHSSVDRNTIISLRHRITKPCIITKVKAVAELPDPASVPPKSGIFLARANVIGDSSVNDITVKQVVRFADESVVDNQTVYSEANVFWPAEPDDFIGWTGEDTIRRIRFKTGNSGDAFIGDSLIDLTSVSSAETDLNATNWTSEATNYVVGYSATSAEGYFASGNYRTPVFDGGASPALLSLTFDSEEENGTSIDVSGNIAFDTVKARAGDSPPQTSLELGDFTGTFYKLNDSTAAADLDAFSINSKNPGVTAREFTAASDIVQNVGGAFFYHEQKDELWVLNLVVSGTSPSTVRPSWEIFDIDTGERIRTQFLTGPVNYSYVHPDSGNVETFEGLGFIPDYDREEIYIIQRENAFFVGAGSYYGIKTDLDGNFKSVIWRSGTIGGNENRINNCTGVTYDGNFFYLLTDTNGDEGELIAMYSWSTDDDIDFEDEITISTITGLGFTAGNDPDVKGLAFNEDDGLFYLYFENVNGSEGPGNRAPEFMSITLTPDVNNDFAASLTTTSGKALDLARRVDGFSLQAGTTDSWDGINNRALGYTADVNYIPGRKTFGILQTLEAQRKADFPTSESYLFNYKSHTFFVESSAGITSSRVLPGIPHETDALWGTLSGTINFEQIQKDSVLFPTGRYGQIEYRLNSSSGNKHTPYLLESKLTQGIRVENIPAAGTQNIFLRTNIPETSTVAEKQGRLKVFWELQED